MMSVLVIEDDHLIRFSLVELLRQEGFHADGASNGQVALDMLQGGSTPDLIVLDLMMPVMNGEEFRAAQLQDTAIAALPVVVLTGDANARRKAERLAADGYLEKPFDPDALLRLVSSLGAGGAGSAFRPQP